MPRRATLLFVAVAVATPAAAADAGPAPPRWPVELGSTPATGSTLLARSEAAILRAAAWMAAVPAADLRFDAAVMLAGIRRTVDGEALRRAFAVARPVGDHDDDNPLRRFWVPDFVSPRAHTGEWPVPAAGAPRANTNRVVAEALHCARNGWRAETTAYVCGPMRDAGGYQTAHGLWALALARDDGCLSADGPARSCMQALADELAGAQPATLAARATHDVDLYAERAMVLGFAGFPEPRLDDWLEALLARQADDGSFGVPGAYEPPYLRYHATGLSAWALAEGVRRALGGASAGAGN